ncbi:MAG TPA: hypothetical protein VK686_02135 [Bryobacteraceae bacterium]|nr:hypothetical protein [Bryobacteraceae bacterium]
MMRTLLLLIAITSSSTRAAESSYAGRAWFPDGTGLEIFAETTGATQASSAQGIIGMNYGRVVRSVVDRDNNALFGYILEAGHDTQLDTIVIRIRPLDSKALEMLNMPALGIRTAGNRIPTVSGFREFRFVRIGEVVTLDILYNPATGEKVYDVLRPITDPSPHPGTATTIRPVSEQLSLKDIALRVNGQDVSAPRSSIVGAAARIDVPGHGSYVIAAYDPKGSGRRFIQSAIAGGESLMWSIDGDDVELTSQTNVLTVAISGTLWVYHDPNFRSQDQPGTVRLQTADTVEWLLPKK